MTQSHRWQQAAYFNEQCTGFSQSQGPINDANDAQAASAQPIADSSNVGNAARKVEVSIHEVCFCCHLHLYPYILKLGVSNKKD